MSHVCLFIIALVGLTVGKPHVTSEDHSHHTLNRLEGTSVSFEFGEVPDIPDEGNPDLTSFRYAITGDIYKWPNGVLTYYFKPNQFTEEIKTKIRDTMKEIEDYTMSGNQKCISFNESSTRLATGQYATINSDGSQCTSNVGKVRSGTTITLSGGCRRGSTITHELMHALGFYHEHTRPDRDQYVSINFTNLDPLAKSAYVHYAGETYGLPYDYGSILHYKPYDDHAIDHTIPTMSATRKLPPRVRMGLAVTMTKYDVMKVQKHYSCPVNTTRIESALNRTTYLVYCDFEEEDSCNLILGTNGNFQWRRRCGPTAPPSTGPKRDFTSGSGTYLYAEAQGNANMIYTMRTPMFKPGIYCLRFALYRYNPDPGVLTFYLEHPEHNNASTIHTWTNQGLNFWKYYVAVFESSFMSNVLFENRVGNGPLSDIALDDIIIFPASKREDCNYD